MDEDGNALLKDVLEAAGMEKRADCYYTFASAPDDPKPLTINLDADLFPYMILFDNDGTAGAPYSWRSGLTQEGIDAAGFQGGWFKVTGLATITTGDHHYDTATHLCDNKLNIAKKDTVACGAGDPGATGKLFPNAAADETGVEKGTDGNWYYLKDGKIQHAYTGVQKNSNGWWYIENGKVDFTYNGFASNEYGWWYLENGQVKFNKNDVIKGTANNEAGKAGEEGWWLVKGSKVTKETTIAKNSNGWWRIEDGKVNFNYTGVAKNEYGWWMCQNGKVNFGYNGFGSNEYGWWYLQNGQVKFDKNDVIKGTANNEAGKAGEEGWWLVRGSKVAKETTIAKNSNGWWRIEDGKVNFNYTGVAKNEYGWWMCQNGKVNFGYTGFGSNEYGWWYVEGGQVKFGKYDVIKGKANDLVTKPGVEGWWLVKDSKVSIETTVAKNANGWWYISNGKVDFNYNGVGHNANGDWYIKNGKVDFSFNGKAYGYTFVNGKKQ